jgi:hypothetical protein
MSNEPLIIGRKRKENSVKVLSLRMTKTDHQKLKDLKNELQFSSVKEFLLYSTKVVSLLKKWNQEGYKFMRVSKNKATQTEIVLLLQNWKHNEQEKEENTNSKFI